MLPELLDHLRTSSNLVLRAEPGAGKTTRVPPTLLAAGFAERGELLVVQPRRIAARMAAQRIAHQLDEPVGQRCGYQVRFESSVSRATRIRFVTEGLLIRRLCDDPKLKGINTVILDEFHERHVDTDVALALLRRLQKNLRPELRIVVMSATLDPEPVATFLEAPVISCPGRTFPIDVEYLPPKGDRPLGAQVVAALRELASTGLDGSVLVFLPGVREIRQSAEACKGPSHALGLEVVALHGDLPPAEQDRAVQPGDRPKVILATNVAETSITINDVVAVIDSGLVRRPSHDPWSGLPTLTLAPCSRASADQRAGRAGRTRAGRCIRLYSKHDFDTRPAFDPPELARLDLAGAMLTLRSSGLTGPNELDWLDAPPEASVHAAETLLRRIEAIDEYGALTHVGRQMLRYPIHPRLARLLVETQSRGVPKLGAAAAALLGERPIRRQRRQASEILSSGRRSAAADVLADFDDLQIAVDDSAELKRRELDRGAVRMVDRVRRQLSELMGLQISRALPSDSPQDDLCMALLVAFPDRVARVETRAGAPDRLVMASGGEAELSPGSTVHGADLIVAVAAEQRQDRGSRRSRTVVYSAAHIEPEWLLELHGQTLVEEVLVRFDTKAERVEAVSQTCYDGLVIDATPLRVLPQEATRVLREAALAKGPRSFASDPEVLDHWLSRVNFLAEHHPETRKLTEEDLLRVLGQMCEGRRSFAGLRKADLLAHLQAELHSTDLAALDQLTPAVVILPGGRRLKVHYERDRPPWVQSRLQDFFGSTKGPSVMGGRVPLVLHLLAPNQRAVQVTTDLAGFWDRHYPEVRKMLMRRYPRHAWPEDPRAAEPPRPARRRW